MHVKHTGFLHWTVRGFEQMLLNSKHPVHCETAKIGKCSPSSGLCAGKHAGDLQ